MSKDRCYLEDECSPVGGGTKITLGRDSQGDICIFAETDALPGHADILFFLDAEQSSKIWLTAKFVSPEHGFELTSCGEVKVV